MIQGNRFKSLARFIYAPPRGVVPGNKYRTDVNNIQSGDYRHLVNTLDKRLINDKDIIYTHTFYADQLAEYLENIDKKVIVITHNSDTAFEVMPPDNVLAWFSTNINIDHERVKSIPIGLENDIWLQNKRHKMTRKLQHKKVFKNLLYINHNIKTNPEKRKRPYEVLESQPWVTFGSGANGQGFDNYLDNIYNHPFVVCPEGNGIDTHRVWECLYVNTIPVVIRNLNNKFYDDLPILFIDDWTELSQRFLHDTFMEFAEKKWNIEKLKFDYWKKYVVSAANS